MGYTHYWTQKRVSEEKMAEVAAAIVAALRTPPLYRLLTPEDGENNQKLTAASSLGEAEAMGGWLFFNGYSNASSSFEGDSELMAETFVLGEHPLCETEQGCFCKTNRKPYDAAVVLALKIALDAGVIKKASGDNAADYTAEPQTLFRAALAEVSPYPPDVEGELKEHITLPSCQEMIDAYRVAAELVDLRNPSDTPLRRAARALSANAA